MWIILLSISGFEASYLVWFSHFAGEETEVCCQPWFLFFKVAFTSLESLNMSHNFPGIPSLCPNCSFHINLSPLLRSWASDQLAFPPTLYHHPGTYMSTLMTFTVLWPLFQLLSPLSQSNIWFKWLHHRELLQLQNLNFSLWQLPIFTISTISF